MPRRSPRSRGPMSPRVPYENIDIYRGQPPGIEPVSCVERIVAGRGGYCFHLNGALITLLEWLQVDVTRHVSGVQGGGADAPGPNGNHLGITARLPDGTEWFVDAGLGDGPSDPLPLVFGTYDQHGFTYELRPSSFDPQRLEVRARPSRRVRRRRFLVSPAHTEEFLAMHAGAVDRAHVRLRPRSLAIMRRTDSSVDSPARLRALDDRPAPGRKRRCGLGVGLVGDRDRRVRARVRRPTGRGAHPRLVDGAKRPRSVGRGRPELKRILRPAPPLLQIGEDLGGGAPHRFRPRR